MKWVASFEGLAQEAAICAYCGYCRAVCPTYSAVGWESCSPRGRVHLARMLLEGVPLSPGQAARIYHCTLCGRCSEVCSTGIDLRRFWLEARKTTAERALGPAGAEEAVRQAMLSGNIYGYDNEERAGWLDYMDEVPDGLRLGERADLVYFVGCSSSFSPRAQRIAESFVLLLGEIGIQFTLLGKDERCCGFPLLAAGRLAEARTLIQENVALCREMSPSAVVFTCPACRLMWMEHYARELPGVRLLHSTEYLWSLQMEGRLPSFHLESRVAYHDPCDLARSGGVHDSPRMLLNSVAGLQILEISSPSQREECCGGGGDLEMVDPSLVAELAVRRVSRLAATGADAAVTACPQCVRTLSRGAEKAGCQVEVMDVVELLARARL